MFAQGPCTGCGRQRVLQSLVLPEPTPVGGSWSGFLPQGVPAALGLGTKLLSPSHKWEAGTSPVTRKGPYKQPPVTVPSQDNRPQAQAGQQGALVGWEGHMRWWQKGGNCQDLSLS